MLWEDDSRGPRKGQGAIESIGRSGVVVSFGDGGSPLARWVGKVGMKSLAWQ